MSKSRYKYTETGGGPWHVMADGQVFRREDGNPKTYTKQHTALMQAEAMLEDGFRTVSITQTSEIRVELANGGAPQLTDPKLTALGTVSRVGSPVRLLAVIDGGGRRDEPRLTYYHGDQLIPDGFVGEDIESLHVRVVAEYRDGEFDLGLHTIEITI